jgi:hypothetical protein
MASIESSSRARRRTKSLKMKTNSSADKIPKITLDGFGYFSTTND